MEDERIVELYLQRQEQAIGATQEKYGTKLRSLAHGITQDVMTAEECENETYWKAWNSIPPREPRQYLYAYLARITRNLALNCCRSREALKRNVHICTLSREMAECLPSGENTQWILEEQELKTAINSFLAELEERKRCVFLRRYWFADSVDQIARRYGMSRGAVKSMLFRMRRQLKEKLQEGGYLP